MKTNITEGLSASVTSCSCRVRRTAMTLLVMLLAMTAATVQAEQNEYWEYFINGDQCVINGYVGDTTVRILSIPGVIDGATVVGFGYDLRKLSNLETLVFEAGIAITDMPTVSGCKNLEHINSADGADCLPASITRIPDYAFTGTKISMLTMPGVTTVGNHAFEGCNTLGAVTLNKPATIGYEAFAKIYDRTQQCVISYPGSVSAWEYTRYHHSPNLVINCSDGSLGWCGDEWVESEHTDMIYNDDCLYWVMKDGNLTIDCVPRDNFWDNYKEKQIIKTRNWEKESVKTLTLDHVYKIQDYYFRDNDKLRTVYVNPTLTEIGMQAFVYCKKLKDLYFDGTKGQWNAIAKGYGWKNNVSANFYEHWRSTSTVSFNANGHGNAPESQTVQWSNVKVTVPVVPTENGFAFKGWYIDADCTKLWNLSTDVVNGDTTLYAKWVTLLCLNDDAVNSADITACDHSLLDVKLTDRTLYIDDKWNTLCLPFSLASLSGTPLDGFTVKELDTDTEYNGHKTGISGNTLYLNFKDATAIEAGKPYIVKSNAIKYMATSGTESYNLLVDGDVGTTWWCFVDYDPGECQFMTASPINVTGYTLTTTGDAKTYSKFIPRKWTLEAKANRYDRWTLIDSRDATVNVDDALPEVNSAEAQYAIAGELQGVYQYFRFTLLARLASDSIYMQLAELTLQDTSYTTGLTFEDVTIDDTAPTAVTSEDGKVSFIGNYDPVTLAANNRSVLYFGSANKLFWPDEDVQLNAFRAHFTLNGTQVAENAAGAKGITNMVIGFGDEDEVVTGINEAAADSSLFTPHSSLSGWHTVSGIRLSGKPSQKGMYIHNGKTVVVE